MFFGDRSSIWSTQGNMNKVGYKWRRTTLLKHLSSIITGTLLGSTIIVLRAMRFLLYTIATLMQTLSNLLLYMRLTKLKKLGLNATIWFPGVFRFKFFKCRKKMSWHSVQYLAVNSFERVEVLLILDLRGKINSCDNSKYPYCPLKFFRCSIFPWTVWTLWDFVG